jgi:hypothetical protein
MLFRPAAFEMPISPAQSWGGRAALVRYSVHDLPLTAL